MRRAKMSDVLIFIEDPGAANYAAHLPWALAERGLNAELYAVGKGKEQLQALGVDCTELPSNTGAEELFASVAPRLVLVGTSENKDTLGLEIISLGQKAGIPTVGVVDGPANPEHRFRGRGETPLKFAPDWIFVADSTTAQAYVALGHPEDRVISCGHPHYDHVREVRSALESRDRFALRQQLLPRMPPERHVLLFAAEQFGGLHEAQFRRTEAYTLAGRGESQERGRIVIEELLDAVDELDVRPYIVLRLHPRNRPDDFIDYANEIDATSRAGDPLEIVYAADLVVGMTSMLLVEAALLGRPTLSILPRQCERGWLPSIGAGITSCATRPSEIRMELRNSFSGAFHKAGNPSVSATEPWAPPGALARVTSTVASLLAT